jgi:hypothetical protein
MRKHCKRGSWKFHDCQGIGSASSMRQVLILFASTFSTLLAIINPLKGLANLSQVA